MRHVACRCVQFAIDAVPFRRGASEKGEDVERLNSQLEQALKELLAVAKSGDRVDMHILAVLAKRSGTEQDRQYMRELLDLGYIAGYVDRSDGQTSTHVHGLSSKAYSYFDDLAAEKKRRKRERRFDRVWSVALLIIGAVIGYAARAIG